MSNPRILGNSEWGPGQVQCFLRFFALDHLVRSSTKIILPQRQRIIFLLFVQIFFTLSS